MFKLCKLHKATCISLFYNISQPNFTILLILDRFCFSYIGKNLVHNRNCAFKVCLFDFYLIAFVVFIPLVNHFIPFYFSFTFLNKQLYTEQNVKSQKLQGLEVSIQKLIEYLTRASLSSTNGCLLKKIKYDEFNTTVITGEIREFKTYASKKKTLVTCSKMDL